MLKLKLLAIIAAKLSLVHDDICQTTSNPNAVRHPMVRRSLFELRVLRSRLEILQHDVTEGITKCLNRDLMMDLITEHLEHEIEGEG